MCYSVSQLTVSRPMLREICFLGYKKSFETQVHHMPDLGCYPRQGMSSDFNLPKWSVALTDIIKHVKPRPVIVIWIVKYKANGPEQTEQTDHSISLLNSPQSNLLNVRACVILGGGRLTLVTTEANTSIWSEIPSSSVKVLLTNSGLLLMTRSRNVEETPMTLVGCSLTTV